MENINQTKEGFIKSAVLSVLILCICLMPFVLFSQIPTRIIVNPGFEEPALGCANSYAKLPQSSVPGWETTDNVSSSTVMCGTAGSAQSFLIELWTSTFNSRSAYQGSQFAETNANSGAFLYQEICLLANESVPFSVWHLRRASSGTGEQIAAHLQTPAGVSIATGSTHTATGVWTNYTGTLTNNASTGLRRYGFRAVSGGNTGNLLDNVTISLKPLVDIKGFTSTGTYELDSNYLNVYVNGTLSSAAIVNLTRTGTSTYLSDYTITSPSRGNISMNANGDVQWTLQPGDYNPNLSSGSTAGLISIKFKALNESVYEANESVTYTISSVSGGGGGNSSLDLASSINGLSAACATTVGSAGFSVIDVTALPVRLIDLRAEREVGYNAVYWTVAEEDNTAKYIVEYSTNGLDYIPAGELAYDPSADFRYVFNHSIGEFPEFSYRLKVKDREGNISNLGDPVTLSRTINNSLSIFPNPNRGVFTVNYFSGREMFTTFRMLDVYGKEVYSREVMSQKGENSFVMGTDFGLENGIYYLSYAYGENTRTVRVDILR